MQARKITLIEIGAGALPVITPPPARRSSWFPIVYVSPDTPPVEGVVPNPVADGVLIEWDAVDQEGVIYIIERGPTQDGPWTEIARVVETRYLYSDGSGHEWWFKITASVRGRPGEGAIVPVVPPPTSQQVIDAIEEQNRLSQEMAEGFANQAAQIADLEGALAATEYDPETAYDPGAVVKWQGGLYVALVETLGNDPSDTQFWHKIGDYSSLAEAVGGQALQIEAQETRIEQAEDSLAIVSERVDGVVVVLDGKAEASALSALSGRVEETESGLEANTEAIQAANAAIAGKASAGSVTALQSTVQQQGEQIDATASALTSVRSTLVSSNNLLTNTQFWNGRATVTMRQNPGGQQQGEGPGLNYQPAYTLAGENTWFTAEAGRGSGTAFPFAEWQFGEAAQVVAGRRYEANIHAIAHRCRFQVKLVFQNSSGVDQLIVASPWVDPTGLAADELWRYVRAGAFGVAPAGATKALCILVKENTLVGQASSYIFAARPYLGEATVAQTQFAPWIPGQSDKGLAQASTALEARTTVNENGIAQYRASWTMSLDANGRVAGIRSVNNGSTSSIDFLFDKIRFISPTGGRRVEYTEGNFRVYDENNVLRVRMGVW